MKNFQDLNQSLVMTSIKIKTQDGMLTIGFNENIPDSVQVHNTSLPVSLVDFSIPEALSMKLMQGTWK